MGAPVGVGARVAVACKRAATRLVPFAACAIAATLPRLAPARAALLYPDAVRMMADVHHLAVTIGPRPAGTRPEAQAARFIAGRLAALGYSVRCQPFPLPGGRRSANVVATRSASQPLLLVGAHYDSRPGSPGAEDNASGVAVLLEAARILAGHELPVQFAAFGAEERTGPGRRSHHFGSRHYVHTAPSGHLKGMVGVLCIDCVGSGPQFRLRGHAGDGGRLARRCRDTAWAHGLRPEGGRAPMDSDHAPFARAGVPVAYFFRLPHPQTHSRRDQPSRVRPAFLSDTAEAVLLAIEGVLVPEIPFPAEPAGLLLRPNCIR